VRVNGSVLFLAAFVCNLNPRWCYNRGGGWSGGGGRAFFFVYRGASDVFSPIRVSSCESKESLLNCLFRHELECTDR
jgi:hypothetical protein